MNDNLVPHAFFSLNLNPDGIPYHPFVRKRVIPALRRKHSKEVLALKDKYQKAFSKQGLTTEELTDKIWGRIIYDIVQKYSRLRGDDRYLGFGLYHGGAHTYIIWDAYQKALYPAHTLEFKLYLSDEDDFLFEPDDTISLRGKLSMSKKNGKDILALKIYFYVADKSENRASDEKVVSANVGMLAELPYFFLRDDRYETLQDTKTTNTLLNMFELELKDFNDDLDSIPTDELGDAIRYPSPIFLVENEYVQFYIS